jgi:hypothetical protein
VPKVLNRSKMLNRETLSAFDAQRRKISAAFKEDAQVSVFVERLRRK